MLFSKDHILTHPFAVSDSRTQNLSVPLWIQPSVSLLTIPQIHHRNRRMSKVPYQEAVGTLMYAALGTRPDIAYAVQVLSKFSKNPGDTHWEAVLRGFFAT